MIDCTVCAYVDKRLPSTLIANLDLLFFVCLVSHIAVAVRFCCKCEKTHWNNQVPEMTPSGNELGTCRSMYSSGCTYTHGVCTICHLWCDFHWCQPKEFSTRLHTYMHTAMCQPQLRTYVVCAKHLVHTYVHTYSTYVFSLNYISHTHTHTHLRMYVHT